MTDTANKLAGNMRGILKTKSEAWCSIQYTDAFLQGSSNNIFGNAFYLNQGSEIRGDLR